MKTPRRTERAAVELQLTPMIDVVFLLLVFFLWTSSFDLPEFDLPSALAEPPAGLSRLNNQTPPPEAFDELVITVSRPSDAILISMNGSPFDSVDQLQSRLAEIVQLGAQPPVIVDPDADIDVGTVIQIYDAARGVGLDRVLFAADE